MKNFYLLLLGILLSMGVTAQNPSWIVPGKYFEQIINPTSYGGLPVPTNLYGSAYVNSPGDPWDAYDG